jgi:hypothetical protein
MMARICWSLVEIVSRLLDERERDVVRGDLAECGSRPGQALGEVLGLVIRRQAALWLDWRPWFAVASLVIPIGLLLSYASRSWGMHVGNDIKNYWGLWDVSYLLYPGYRNDVIRLAVWIGATWVALIGWSWTCGFVVGRFSPRALWLTVSMFALVIFAGTLGTVTAGQRQWNPSLMYHLVFVVSPRLVRTFLVILPMVWGAYRGRNGAPLSLMPTLVGVLLMAGATVMVSQSFENSIFFPKDPGPDGFVVSADDPRPWWPLSFVVMWPAAYILTITAWQQSKVKGHESRVA